MTLTKNDEGQWVDQYGRVFQGYGQMHNTEELEKTDEQEVVDQ
jgi:hypothetical protein